MLNVGCATTVTARRLLPARYDINNIHSLVVRHFIAFDDAEQEAARLLTETVNRRLEENDFIQLISMPREEIAEERGRSKISWLEVWRHFGEGVHADAVLGGDIDLAEEGALVLTLHLLDVSTEKMRAGSRLIEREGTMAELSERMAARVVEQVTPQLVTQKLTLVRHDQCREGIALAQQNQWAAAMESWHQAAIGNQNNHAALYNIGAAEEFFGLLNQARAFYSAAQDIAHRSLYQKALQRVEQLISEQDKRRTATAPPTERSGGDKKGESPTFPDQE